MKIDQEVNSIIRANLKVIITVKGETMNTIAKKMGMSYSMFFKRMSSDYSLSLDIAFVIAVCNILDVKISDVLPNLPCNPKKSTKITIELKG